VSRRGPLYSLYLRVQDASISLRSEKRALHRAFAIHLTKIGTALHDLEGVLSGEFSPGAEDEAIDACLSMSADSEFDEAQEALVVAKVDKSLKALRAAIADAQAVIDRLAARNAARNAARKASKASG